MREIEIHFDQLDEVNEAQLARAEARLRALASEHDDLLAVRLSGHHSQHHRAGGREVRIVAKSKGKDLFASRVRPRLGLALHDALDAFEHELRNLRSRRTERAPQRAPAAALLGIVDRVLRREGYGFIVTDAGDGVYFHRNAVSGGLDFEKLEEGQRIALSVEQGEQGLQASAVLPAAPDAPSP